MRLTINFLPPTSYEDRHEKCKCGKPAAADHPCPWNEEINGDSETLCDCCDDCTQQCAYDV